MEVGSGPLVQGVNRPGNRLNSNLLLRDLGPVLPSKEMIPPLLLLNSKVCLNNLLDTSTPYPTSTFMLPLNPSITPYLCIQTQLEIKLVLIERITEIERASDNLLKSGKMYPLPGTPGRRDSMPAPGARPPFNEYPGPSRHHSVSDYDAMRPHSASNLQNFYANQRFAPRGNDDQTVQAKRRMAAQRERELRNYHQEQQYNRSLLADMSGAKSDRSLSPNAMTEEDRRELLNRQHRALYGNEASLYGENNPPQRPTSQDARVNAATGDVRGNSPLAFDPFGMQGQNNAPGAVQMPRDQMPGREGATGQQDARANSNSPSSTSNNNTAFSLFENAQQSSRTSASSPGGSPPRSGSKGQQTSAGVAPIGTRPAQAQNQAVNPALNKRSTTPLPSPLSYGFSASDANNNNGNSNNNERSTSTSSNPSSSVADKGVGLGWGSNSGVWGSSKNLGVQASVWG
ncbi:hypothetical protein M501DRAFT_235279 [Patellaria atrata CBS 101060]|uniref:Uncharacterized protein n=1 Tax=Patellaria atrata CBS 101060 TaxID=1346257 RepID=A0A9P4VKX3_9PEZI|nr:hypothetical protein M501DRAFT_235279 [Patellaria atrata CBS 101060]